jgi:hypothetical protein
VSHLCPVLNLYLYLPHGPWRIKMRQLVRACLISGLMNKCKQLPWPDWICWATVC